ncbi:MAG: DUF262 domain-containing protein [Archangium sp.]|nr:DUF262 domain-containing protein [Archangium sp.]MDP3571064.1 DUF262 domain-containing protein [Archangium sp.]
MVTRGKTQIRSFRVEELLDWAKAGRLRVPDFQRKLRWEPKNVVELFDSIYRSYPIGTLLFAKRGLPPASSRFGSVVVPPVAGADTHWIIDGQQRVTSIVGTLLHPDLEPRSDQFSVYFELEREEFFVRRRREVTPTSIPLRELRDSTTVLSWLRRWPLASERPDLEPRVFELSQAIREFTVAAAIVEGDDALLRSIFVRTNRAGVDMQESEVFEALYGLTPQRSLAAAAARLSSGPMGELEANTLLRCAKHVAGMDPGARPEDLEGIDPQFVERAESAIRAVLGFVSDDCQLPHLDLVPQRFFLMPLARYFALFPRPSLRARRLLRRWVWRGLVTGSFEQTGFGPVRKYQSAISSELHEEEVARQMLALVGSELRHFELPDRWVPRSLECKMLVAMLLRGLDDAAYEMALEDLTRKGMAKSGTWLTESEAPEAWVPVPFERVSGQLEALGFDRTAIEALEQGDLGLVLKHRRVMLELMLNAFVVERCEVDLSDRPSISQLVGAA